MGKWKDALLRSLDGDSKAYNSYEIGVPATERQLAGLETKIAVKIPSDLRELLLEFNGVTSNGPLGQTDYYFSTETMADAGKYYREWESATAAMSLFENVLFVCQENGFASMWAVVVRPFAAYRYGEVVSFDHDRIDWHESEIFTANYNSLLELVQDPMKSAG